MHLPFLYHPALPRFLFPAGYIIHPNPLSSFWGVLYGDGEIYRQYGSIHRIEYANYSQANYLILFN